MENTIYYAESDNRFILKFVGDIRLTLSAGLDKLINDAVVLPSFADVMIDLSEAVALDSTTLGLLAKIAIEADARYNYKPMVFCDNADVLKIFRCMGLHKLFVIEPVSSTSELSLAMLPKVTPSEAQLRDKVIEAHEILSSLNNENRHQFKSLLSALKHTGVHEINKRTG